jgi:hypothetical protein
MKVHGRSPIFVDAAPALLVMSLVTCKTLFMSFDDTRVQDETFAGDSFNGGIALTVAAMDITLKDTTEVGRKILDLGREVKRMEMNSRVIKERVTPTQAIDAEFSCLKDVNVVYTTGGNKICGFWPTPSSEILKFISTLFVTF